MTAGSLAPDALALLAGPSGPPPDAASVPLLVLVALSSSAGLVVFDVEVGEQAHGVTVTEVPLVIGLFLAGPLALLVARVSRAAAGTGPAAPPATGQGGPERGAVGRADLDRAERSSGQLGRPDPARPGTWLPVLAAVLLADLLGHAAVHALTGWTGPPRSSLSSVPMTALCSAAVNTSVGLVAVLLLRGAPRGARPSWLVPAAVGQLALRAHLRLQRRHRSLRLLHDVTVALGAPSGPTRWSRRCCTTRVSCCAHASPTWWCCGRGRRATSRRRCWAMPRCASGRSSGRSRRDAARG